MGWRSPRAGGGLLVAVGLYAGALSTVLAPPMVLAGVVVPLAAGGSPSTLTAAAFVLAALAAVLGIETSPDGCSVGGFTLWAIAALVAPIATDNANAAVSRPAAPGGWAGAVLVAVGVLAQASLLSKVVAAILAGVMAMGIVGVGVVGNVVVSSYDQQTRDTVMEAAN